MGRTIRIYLADGGPSRLIQMGLQAGRAVITNGTAPSLPPLPEPDIADMEFFLEQVRMMSPVLGFTSLVAWPDTMRNFSPGARLRVIEAATSARSRPTTRSSRSSTTDGSGVSS